MAKRKLTREETDYMRNYIKEGIDRGETAEQIRQRRHELADVFECSLPQVRSATAWKIQEGTRLKLEKLITAPQKAPDPNCEEMQPSTGPASSEGEPTASPEDTIATTTSESNLSGAGITEEDPGEILSTEIVASDTAEQVTLEAVNSSKITVHPKSGAWTDYESSEIKRKFRAVEYAFIDRHIDASPEKRAKMKILCTPGIKCHLEVRGLLERNFKPENIFAIEREKGAWSEFETNCRTLGIRPLFGDLQKILPDLKEKFDIALIDFLGQSCPAYEKIMYALPLADKAMIALNMWGKMEQKREQRNMRISQWYLGDDDGNEARTEELKRAAISLNLGAGFSDVINELLEDVEARRDSDVEISDELRDANLLHLLRDAGTGREDNWVFPEFLRDFPDMYEERQLKKIHRDYGKARSLLKALADLERDFIAPHVILKIAPYVPRNKVMLLSHLSGLALENAVGARRVVHIEKYRYLSKVGETPSPYLTNLAIVEKPTQELHTMRATTEFMLTGARAYALVSNDQLTTKQCKFGSDDRSCEWWLPNEQGVLTPTPGVTFDQMLKDLETHKRLDHKYPFSHLDNVKLIERIQLDESDSPIPIPAKIVPILKPIVPEPVPIPFTYSGPNSRSASYRFGPEPIQRDAPKIGRNDKCPCGSRKKFKNCCLRNS